MVVYSILENFNFLFAKNVHKKIKLSQASFLQKKNQKRLEEGLRPVIFNFPKFRVSLKAETAKNLIRREPKIMHIDYFSRLQFCYRGPKTLSYIKATPVQKVSDF